MHPAAARLTAVVLLTGATLCSLPTGAQFLWDATGSSPGFKRLVEPLDQTSRELSLRFYSELKTLGRGRATGDHEDALSLTARGDGMALALLLGGAAARGRDRASTSSPPAGRPRA